MARNIAVLPGDGIGPEVTAEAVKVLERLGGDWTFETALVGGAAYDDGGHPLPAATLDLCRAADAVLFGAVGGPRYDAIPDPLLRPELGALLPLRKALNLYANVRPAKTPAALAEACPLKNVDGVDFVVVRELTGGPLLRREVAHRRRRAGHLRLHARRDRTDRAGRLRDRADARP